MSTKLKIFLGILIFLIIFLIGYLYAMFIGTSGFHVKEYKITNKNLNKDYDGFKIAHLSDIHYGNISTTKKDLEKIVEDVNKLKPDIIVITGDLLDDKITDEQYADLVEVLKGLKANLAKYIIDGNHDTYDTRWAKLVEEAELKNLNDTYEVLYDNSYSSIFIAGVSNNTFSKKSIKEKTAGIFSYMNSEEFNSSYKILLMHEPDYVEDLDYKKFDLVLAGHSHNGQVRIPFIGATILPDGCKKYYDEYYNLDDTDLYISSGIGTSTLPIRLFNRPSYNFYRIVNK